MTADDLLDDLKRAATDTYATACAPYVDAVMERLMAVAVTAGLVGLLVGTIVGLAVGLAWPRRAEPAEAMGVEPAGVAPARGPYWP